MYVRNECYELQKLLIPVLIDEVARKLTFFFFYFFYLNHSWF